jgi:hypothetical protein
MDLLTLAGMLCVSLRSLYAVDDFSENCSDKFFKFHMTLCKKKPNVVLRGAPQART